MGARRGAWRAGRRLAAASWQQQPGRGRRAASQPLSHACATCMIVSVKTDLMHAVTHACIRILNHMRILSARMHALCSGVSESGSAWAFAYHSCRRPRYCSAVHRSIYEGLYGRSLVVHLERRQDSVGRAIRVWKNCTPRVSIPQVVHSE